MSHRTAAVARFARIARFARATVSATVLAAALALAAGCDKGSKSATPTPSGTPTVGVVDYDRVFKDMQWMGEIDKDLQGTGADLKTGVQTWEDQLTAAVNAEKTKIARAAQLNDREIADLNANKDLDKLTKLSSDQRTELYQTLNNAYGPNGVLAQVQQQARQIFEQRRVQIVNAYRESLKPSVRRVAEKNGLLIMVTPIDPVQYYSPTVDMTNNVIDDLRQAPPPHNLPEPPKLQLPKGPIQLTAPPTTAPAAPAVGPTTRTGK